MHGWLSCCDHRRRSGGFAFRLLRRYAEIQVDLKCVQLDWWSLWCTALRDYWCESLSPGVRAGATILRPARRRAPGPRSHRLAREATIRPRSRVAHADCATLMESRVVVVATHAAGSFTAPRSVAGYRSLTSCTTSSAYRTR